MGEAERGTLQEAEKPESDYLETPFGPLSDEDESPDSEPRNLSEDDWHRLKAMLERLPARERESARHCWDENTCPENGGINRAAWNHWHRNQWDAMPDSRGKLEPNQLEAEIEAIIATARDLKSKLERVNWESMNLIRNAVDAQAGGDSREYFEETRNIKDWFKLSWWDCFEDGYDSDDEVACAKSNCKFGVNLGQLEHLAQSLAPIAQEFAARKQSPNGAREDRKGDPILWLVGMVWDSLAEHKRPKAHILPIARIIHEWATDGREIPGPTWGERRLKRITAMRKGVVHPADDRIAGRTPA